MSLSRSHNTSSTTVRAITFLILAFFDSLANGQVTLIDFETIPPYPTTVDSFGDHFPGLTLASDNQWLADEVNNSVFENIQGRSISTLGAAPLTVSFDLPVRDIVVDLGSGELGMSLTIGIAGYVGGQPVFSENFITHPVAGGADEVRAHTFGIVDSIVMSRTAGSAGLTLDNLSFAAVPEPGSFLLIGLGLATVGLTPRRRAYGLACVAVLCLAVWLPTANAAQPFFMGLGDLPGGSFNSRALDVSADGSVVVGVGRSTPGAQAFRWTQNGGMIGLGDLPGANFFSAATGVSDDGSVVVGSSNYYLQWGGPGCGCYLDRPGAFRWTQAGGMTLLGAHGTIGTASDVSADGSVVVGDTFYNGPFRWTQETGMEFLTSVGTALGVSTDGSVVVVVGGGEVLRWTLGAGVVSLGELGDLPGGELYSDPLGVSADGSIVVGRGNAASGSEAFRWTQSSGIIGLGVRSGFDYSWANDVSNGSVVVGFNGIYNTSAFDEAFLWDATHGMRSLREALINDFGLGASLSGWSLRRAEAITADGQFIVGSGTNPSGNTEAWLARVEPFPDLPGDFNHDGTVDAADYVVWRKTDGTPAGYNAWRSYFGQAAGGGAGLPSTEPLSAAVPEPTSLFLCASSLWAIGIFAFRKPWRDWSGSRRLGSNVV